MVEHIHKLHNKNRFKERIWWGFRDENIIATPDDGFEFVDPGLCWGRASMDIAKFCRSILFKTPDIGTRYVGDLICEYEERASCSIPRGEVGNILGIDVLAIMQTYLSIPEESLNQFPPMVRKVQEEADFYLDIVERELNGVLPS